MVLMALSTASGAARRSRGSTVTSQTVPHSYGANVVAQYETAEGLAEIFGMAGGFAVFVGGRLVQRGLGTTEIVCYLAHALQAAHHKLGKCSSGPSREDVIEECAKALEPANHPLLMAAVKTIRALSGAKQEKP
jgi:hypothetical protein